MNFPPPDLVLAETSRVRPCWGRESRPRHPPEGRAVTPWRCQCCQGHPRKPELGGTGHRGHPGAVSPLPAAPLSLLTTQSCPERLGW